MAKRKKAKSKGPRPAKRKTAQQKRIGAFGKSIKSAAKGYKKGKGVRKGRKMLYGAAAAAYLKAHGKKRKSPKTKRSR